MRTEGCRLALLCRRLPQAHVFLSKTSAWLCASFLDTSVHEGRKSKPVDVFLRVPARCPDPWASKPGERRCAAMPFAPRRALRDGRHRLAELGQSTRRRGGAGSGHRRRLARPGIRAPARGGAHLQLGDLAVKVACHDAFAQQFEAAHFGFDQAAPVVAAPPLPYRPAQPACRPQDFVASIGTATVRFPGLGVLAARDDWMSCRKAMASWQAFVS